MNKLYIKSPEKFKKWLATHGYTQKKFAEMIGINSAYLSTIINQHRSVGTRTANKISKIFNSEITEIFFWKSDEKIKDDE